MSKNIQVKLTFSTDTKAAQQQINQLQQTLSNIAATPISGSGLKTAQADIQAATSKALELKIALQNATNVNTGKLNFNKFNQELKKNKTTLKEYAMQLQKLGPEGVQAFSQLAQSIRTAETPLVSMQGKLAALGQTFMNTVKWSISSSMIQGVTRAFTSTIDYAKELNESLTNIRIVTGKSVAGVSKFAVEANKAAKALSATTDEYAKASLIYFQQGLNDSAVAERTATTLKLAKVVGESAETVSEWMTAIWNNFDDGSRSLENYADVLAKLGAATASSADEIAGGLEKFAAVAETVGLSYEYAASALATITAETRQSEDVVGTALKTIFARVENLKLGESLEDGTTLGQYSEALSKVGVNIKDSNGNLKEMDDILKGIGTQWQILNRDQQVALAQSVAGIRQYSQFMALMDNWDVMEENVKMAKEANGALENQHEIWETGIEGATSRVKEELNEIKNSLLGENDLLPLLNIAEGFLDFVGDLIDSLGGLPGLLSIIASVGLKLWGPQAAAGLTSMINGVKSLYGVASGKSQAAQKDMVNDASQLERGMVANVGSGQRGMVDSAIVDKEAKLTSLIMENEKNISADKKQQIEFERQLLQLQEKRLQKIADEHDAAQSGADKARRKLETMNVDNDDVDRLEAAAENTTNLNNQANAFGQMEFQNSIESADDINKQGQALLDQAAQSPEGETQAIKDARQELTNVTNGYSEALKNVDDQEGILLKKQNALKEAQENEANATNKSKKKRRELHDITEKINDEVTRQQQVTDDAKKAVTNYDKKIKSAQKTVIGAAKGVNEYGKTLEELKDKYTEAGDVLEEFGDNSLEAAYKNIELEEGQKDLGESFNNTKKNVEDAAKAGQGWTTSFVNAMQGVASGAAGLQMITGAFDSLTTSIADGTAGFSEYLSAITSVAFGLPMLINGLGTMAKMLKLNVVWEKLLAGIKKVSDAAEDKYLAKKLARNNAEKASDSSSAIVKWAKMLVDWPVGTLTAIALAVPVMAIIGGGIALGAMSVNSKQEAKQQEEKDNKAIETAEGALEVAEGWNEESQAMDDLIDKHNKLKAANDQTIEGQKALKEAQQAVIDQVPQLIEKYKELDEEYENLSLADDINILEGAAANKDVEQVEQTVNSIDQKIAQETSSIAKEGQSGAAGRTLAAIAKQTGDDVDNKTIDWHVGDAGSDVGETRLSNILGQEFDGEGVNISLDASDPKEFVNQYEKLQQFVKEMEEAGETSDDTYREVKEGIDAAAESYEKLKKLVDDSKFYEIQERVNELGINPSTINSYDEYDKVKKQLTKDTELLKIATKEEIATWLEGNKTLSAYATLEKKVLAYSEKYGKQVGDKIKEHIRTLNSEDDLTAFLKIDFDKVQAKSAWDNLTQYYKQLEESEKYKKDASGAANAIKNLKSNGTRKDYEKLQDSISWGENGIIEYSEFLSKSYQEQETYLQQLQIQINNFEVSGLQKGLKELYQAYNDAAKEGDKVAKQNIADMIEQHKISIELAKKEAEASRKAQKRKAKERKQNIRDLRNEIDVYKELNDAADDLSRVMDKLSNAKEYAYGSEHLALIEGEIKAIEKENELLDNTIWLAEKMAKKNKDELSNFGAKFDKNGNISNYNVIKGQYLNKMAKYDKDSDEYKDIEQELANFETAAQNYEENLSKAEKATDQKAENMRKKLDKELEGIQYSVDVKIDINDTELKRLQYLAKSFDNPLYDNTKKVQNAQKQAKAYEGNIKAAESGIDKTLKNAGASKEQIAAYKAGNASAISGLNLSSKEIEALEGYSDTILENQESLEDLNETVRDSLMETFNAWQDKMEEVGASFDTLGGIVGNFQNIIDTVGEGILGISEEQRKEMEQMSLDAANGRLATNKAKMEFTQSSLKTVNDTISDMEKSGKKTMKDSEGKEQTLEWWKEQQATLNQQLLTDQEAFTSSWADALQVAADIFQAQMDRAFDDMDDKLAGTYGSLAELQTAFDQDQDIMNRYLDGGEKLYELSKLNRQIQKDIDKSTNTKAQRELAELQEIIKAYQADGVEMSKYELEALQKKYDLKVAEIALEEAQNAKSQVRLRKDANGNMSYVYTADENKTADAAQKYEDELEANRKLAEEQSTELTSQIIQNRQAMVDALREINASDYATTEEYLKAIDEKKQFYTDKETYLVNEYNKTIGRSQLIYAQDFASYNGWSGKKIDTAQLLKEKLGDAETEMGQNTSGFVENYSKAMEAMGLAMDLPEISAGDLVKALGDGKSGEGDGCYNTVIANTAAWASGMYGQSENAAASFSLLIGKKGDKDSGGICGVIAELGDGTTTGYYKDALGNTSSFIGTVNDKGSFTGILDTGGQQFDLINTGAKTLLDDLGVGTKGGSKTYDKIITTGDTFVSSLNTTIGGVKFSKIKTNADNLKTTLGTFDDPKSPLGGIYSNVSSWQTNVDTVMGNAGTSIEDFSKDANTFLFGEKGNYAKPTGGVAKTLSDSEDTLGDYAEAANKAFTLSANEQTKWNATQQKIVDNKTKIDNLYTSLKNLKKDYTGNNAPDVNVDVEIPNHQELKDLINELNTLSDKEVNVKVKYDNEKDKDSTYNPEHKYTFTSGMKTTKGDYLFSDGSWYTNLNLNGKSSSKSELNSNNLNTTYTFNSALTASTTPRTISLSKLKLDGLGAFSKSNYFYNYDKDGNQGSMGYASDDTLKSKLSSIKINGYKKTSNANLYRLSQPFFGTYWFNQTDLNQLLGNDAGKKLYNDYALPLYRNWDQMEGFDTGGYTGDWGTEGRMAMLHQKEIVLNAHDTENFLKAIEIVRSISNRLDQQANMMSMGLSSVFAQFKPVQKENDILQQEIHITAEFPNATNHNEIEEAFRNLPNLAAQYIYRS